MPANKDLKRLIRARMARTGESYSTARLHVLRASPVRSTAGAERTHAMHFTTGIEDGRRIVAAHDVPADYRHSLARGLGFRNDQVRAMMAYRAGERARAGAD